MTEQVTPSILAELPEELQAEIKLGTRNGPSTPSYVLDVIPSDEPVDLNQILVAVWRKHNVVVKRATTMAAINSLRKQGKVRRCGRGSFILGFEDMSEAA